MKKIIFLLVFIPLLGILCNAQQYSVIKTPTNVSVESIIKPEYSPAVLAQLEQQAADWIAANHSDAVRVGAASHTYNCHDYAWNMSDGGVANWVNQKDQLGNANIAKYWSGTYPTYTTATANDYTKVFLPNGDHSAITTATFGIFKSKWGDWGRYISSLASGNTPYNPTGMQAYKLIITGDNQACIPNVKTYTTINLNPAYSTYSWTSDNFTVSSSTYTASATASTNGSGYVQVTVGSSYSGTTVTGKIFTWVGVPVVTVTGDATSDCTNTTHYFGATADYFANESNYTWELIPLNGNYLSPYGYHNNHCAITFYNSWSASGYTVGARAQNSCGTGGYGTTSIYIHNCYYFSLSPNPASETVTVTKKVSGAADGIDNAAISEDATTIYTIRIIDFYGTLYYSAKKSGDSFTFPVSSLKDGQYIVQITDGKNPTNLTLIVKH